jgi:nitroimidazol reductase NimA-like FMN-containing flavoprotein (pyridoxamine 5'-phosphate oxidase superfamily)
MSTRSSIELGEDERNEFLGDGGTGVMAFPGSGDGPPHAIPISYGYDAAEATFYFRLAVGPDSRKGDVDGRAVSFVVHGDGEGPWRSVVAEGRLERTTDDSIATETLQGLERVRIPLFDVFEKPPGEVAFEFYRLVPDELTGRTESKSGL